MINFSSSLKVLVALEPCDFRKGFNGLHALVTERLIEGSREVTLFVFISRRHTRLKNRCRDGTRLWALDADKPRRFPALRCVVSASACAEAGQVF
jgi:transposase